MRLGSTELNESESTWCQNKAKEILSQARSDLQVNLNKAVTDSECAGLLKYLWSNNTVTEESFTEEPVEDENGEEIE
jgi:hypothetical protein